MCHIFLKICGIKLNDEHFSRRTVIIPLWNKPYQELNFKSHWNTVILWFAHVPFNSITFYLFVLNFAMKLKDINYKSHWNILVFYDQ